MILKKIKIIFSLFFFLLLLENNSYGFDKPIRLVATPALENNPPFVIITNASQMVQLGAPNGSYDKEIIGTVKLSVKTNAPQYIAPYDAELNLLITTYNASGNIISNTTNVLKVSHQPFNNNSYKDQDYIVFNSQTNKVYKIVTQITQIKINGNVVNSLPDNLLVQSTIDYLRYDPFSYSAIPNSPVITPLDQDGDSNPDVLQITWNPMTGAVHYELEYTSINDYDISGFSNPKPASSLTFDFKNNSTRIVTFANSYTVPLVFDRGYFLCRVRGFGRSLNSSLLPFNGTWSYGADAGVVSAFTSASTAWYSVSHFESLKNWQYNTTFAEEGKHKEVINYADGSLRSRQTITKINSQNSTIVGENVYDYTGRSAVNILPSPLPPISFPGGSSSFQYKLNFNISDNSNLKYSKDDFDLDKVSDLCNPSAAGLNNNFGASQYYSPNNPDKTDYQAFVPDAQKFPFSQVEYTPDNTGRIKKQGGLGINHQLGSTHETKYFYGAPEQIEIDRLFGSEVGDASHYQKNMVIDANGQVSISYMDMEGKTIATSLAGSAPANMLNMPKQPSTAVNLIADMFNKDAAGVSETNLVNPSAEAISFNKSILVTDNSQVTFNYNMSIGKFPDPCLAANVCFNCVYDYEFKIVNDCGNTVYSTVSNGKKMIGRFNIVNGDTVFTTACFSPVVYNYSETTPPLTLAPGVYYVSKNLKINADARNFYLQKYLSPTYNTCNIKTLANFQQAELAKIDTTDCFVTCESCFKSLGTKDDYVSLGKGTEEEWDAKYEECKALCGYPKTPCEISLGQLLIDVSPNGQYGEYLNTGDPLSVFNPANLLPKNVAPNGNINSNPVVPLSLSTAAYWKHPVYYKTPSTLHYYDNKGKISKIPLTKVPGSSNPGGFNYAVDNLLLVSATPTPGVYSTYPENLTNLDDFILHWQPSYAKSLVTYHPEYCYYEDCRLKFDVKSGGDSISSNTYDSKLLFTTTLQSAILKQLVVPTSGGGYKLNLAHDPATKPGYFSPAYSGTPLNQKYTTYYTTSFTPLTLHEFVSYTFKCGSQYGNNQSSNTACTNFGAPIVGSQQQVLDMQNKEWNSLKAIYFAEKQKLLYDYSNAKRLQANATCKYYNACIGDASFDGYSTPMVKYTQPGNVLDQSSAYFNPNQPCNQIIKDLYVNKVKRFGYVNNVETPDENEIAYQAFLQTGKCPVALDLQNLMDGLAHNGKLSASSEALQNYPQLTLNLYDYLNNASPPPTPYTSFLWQANILGGNVLNMNIKKAIGNIQVKFVQFSPPTGGINWNNVQGVTQFMHTGSAGANQTFSCTVKELVGSSTYYKTVTGITDVKLDGCMFKDVCKPNDLAKQLQTVMSALKASGNFQNTSGYSLGAPGSNTFYGPYLQKAQQLVGQTSGTPNFKWQFVNGSNLSYDLYDAATPSCKLRINLLTLNNNPISGLSLTNAVAFKKIRSDYQNFFTMEARDANNTLIGIVRGEIFKICAGQTFPISMGTCDKPDPASCQTPFHQNRKDLESLLKDILQGQKYLPVANSSLSNVLTNVNLTNNLIGNFQPLASNIPATKFVVTNNFNRVLSGEIVTTNAVTNDSVAFVLKSPCVVPPVDPNQSSFFLSNNQVPPCQETVYCKVWLKTNNKSGSTSNTLNNVITINKLVACGPVNNNNYKDFYLLAKYQVGNTTSQDTIFGSSCFELQNCNPCKDTIDCCGGSTFMQSGPQQSTNSRQKDSLAVVTGIAVKDSTISRYIIYTAKIDTLNARMAWTPSDTSYIQPISYLEMTSKGYSQVLDNYHEYIDRFDSTLDSRLYLKSIAHFAKDYGNFKNPVRAYARYIKATNKYNVKATSVSVATINPIADSTFYKNSYVDSINVYIDYLTSSQPSSSVQKADSFFMSRSGLGQTGDPCETMYSSYVNAYLQFTGNPLNLINCRMDAIPLYPYSTFVGYNYCCPPNYIAFTNYINSFYNTNPCPQPLIPFKSCTNSTPPDIKECVSWYNSYLIAINQYNTSNYATSNNVYLSATLFADLNSFYQQGYCVCVNAYIGYLMQYINAALGSNFNPPVSIKDWQGCGPGTGPNTCDETYNNYIAATNNFLNWLTHHPLPGFNVAPVIYDITEFTNNGLCYCAPGYISFLNGITSGAITDINYINDNFSINSFCNQKNIVCPNVNALDTVVSPPVPPTQNPCVKYKKDLAMANAALAYQQYVQMLTTQFITSYNKYCLGAVENLTRNYTSKEFHYTLYYYDQAGNLIRTIPPEGLDAAHYTSITAFNSPKELQIKTDRLNKIKTVFTNHGMATTYQYNSLNQLVKQKMPDHDPMNFMKYKFNYGIDTSMNVVTSQFPEKNKGYIGGYESYTDPIIGSFKRGKIFESTDGSLSWKSLGNLTGSDLNKVQFIANTNYGFGVGSDGAFVFSVDGGVNWDYFPIHEYTNNNSTLNDLFFYQKNANTIEGLIAGDNGTVIKVNFSNGNATVINYNGGLFNTNYNVTDITSDNGVNPSYFITVLDKVANTSKIYSSNGQGNNGNWNDITATRLPNLNKVRQLKTTSTYFAVGSDGNLLKSVDDGATWALQETNTALTFGDVYFATSKDGVAVLVNAGGIGSLYKTNDGGNNWTLLDAGTTANNYKTLSPYVNLASNTIDKLTANGTNGLVKRVTINYTTPSNVMIGAVSTLIGSVNQINDVCVVPYDITTNPPSYKQLAIAVGNAGDLHYCIDYNQNTPAWQPVVSGLSGGLSKALVKVIANGSNFDFIGVLLDNAGTLYKINAPGFNNQNPIFSIASLIPGTTNVYKDITFDWNNINPYNNAYVIAKNVNNQTLFGNIALQTIISPPVLFTSTPPSLLNVNSVVVNGSINPNMVLAVGTNGDISRGTTTSINSAGTISYANNSSNITPVRLNDVLIDPVNSKVIVVGNDGYFAEKTISGTNPFQVKNSNVSSDINSAKYAGQFGGSIYVGCSKQGEFLTIFSSAGLTLGGSSVLLSSSPLNDIDINPGNTGEAYLVGDNGAVFYRTSAGISPASVASIENLNCVTYYPTGNRALTVGNLTSGFDLSGLSSINNRNWFTNQINKLHFTDVNNGYFVGTKGLIRHTTDGGFTWKSVKPYINAGNQPIDHYAVYTTTLDKAIIAGSNNYISNVNNLSVSPFVTSGGNGFASETWYDIDLANSTSGFVVGSNTSNNTAKAVKLNVVNNSVFGNPVIISSSTLGEGLRSVYAFKDIHAGKFMAVGDLRTIKIYNGSTYATVTYPNQSLASVFPNANDIIYDLDFSDNSTGYLVGTRTRFASMTLDLTSATIPVNLTQQVTSIGTLGGTNVFMTNGSSILTISLIDDVTGFLGGYVSSSAGFLGKYGWKFIHEKGQTSTLFWYDRLGRMVVSQNTKQLNKPVKAYSYTLYDALGRITEVGEKAENTTTGNLFDNIFGTYVGLYYNTNAIDDSKMNNWISDNTGSRIEVTHTYYDDPFFTSSNCPLPSTFTQDNLRKRVASVTYEDVFDNNPCTYNHATHYSYDIHGNVKNLLQDNKTVSVPAGNPLAQERFKRVDYDYDLISGKVNQVSYQKDQPDAFHHRYEYDEDNRITEVKTSRNGNVWETDAKYFYYKHGPLARVEYGHDKVQGMDYAYTIQGWIKGVNSNKLTSANDIGKDGNGPATLSSNTNKNKLFAQDAMGYSLGYFAGDYSPIETSLWASANRFESVTTGSSLEASRNNLYNGNITHMATSIVQPLNITAPLAANYVLNPLPAANAYKYDQVNRIRQVRYFENLNAGANTWATTAPALPTKYKNDFIYDDNGNIINQSKWDENGASLDNINYLYNTSGTVGGKLKQNRLYSIQETAAVTSNPDDIETPGFNFNITEATINQVNNYGYDEMGNLIRDAYEGIQNITWTVYGKIKTITRPTGSTKKNMRFDYDAQGNRIAKHIFSSSNVWESSTYYVRDAQGNVMGTYKNEMECINCPSQNQIYVLSYKLKERDIYGSCRIGLDEHTVEMLGVNYNSGLYERSVGNKLFEMGNHLGNNLTVVSDRKIPVQNGGAVVDHFIPQIISSTDYYAFGQTMPGRNFSSAGYRYGFNNKEKDDEFKGSGNSYDFGARIFDPRLGGWLSTDPLQSKCADLSPYNFVGNNPILFIDPDGKVIKIHYMENGKNKYYTYKPGIKPATNNEFVQQVHQAVIAAMKNDKNKTFQNISDSKETVTIRQIATDEDQTTGTLKAGGNKVENVAIDWNPTTGLKTTNGGALTPATALLHEAAHAERYINADTKAEMDALKKDAQDNKTNYDNNEEQRTITNVETPYVKATNNNQPFNPSRSPQQEGTRTDHRGTTYKTTGVTSITPADGTKVSGESIKSDKYISKPDNTRVAPAPR